MLLFAYSRIVSAVLVVEDTTLIRVLRQCRDARLRSRALYCWKISAGETKSVCARLRSFFSPPVRNWKMGFSPRPTSCHATRRQDFSATRFIRFLRSNARIARTPPHRENLENSPQRRTKRRLRGAGLKLRR